MHNIFSSSIDLSLLDRRSPLRMLVSQFPHLLLDLVDCVLPEPVPPLLLQRALKALWVVAARRCRVGLAQPRSPCRRAQHLLVLGVSELRAQLERLLLLLGLQPAGEEQRVDDPQRLQRGGVVGVLGLDARDAQRRPVRRRLA